MAVSLSPFADTAEFYNWYYDRIVGVARRILRERINPVTLAISSAPTIGSGEYDARQAGPSAWNESQWHSIADGPEPGFGLIWGHFDWSVKTDNMFWGFLLMRSGHNNYWVDVPLMFNNDLTHTRSSFAMRQWTRRLAGHERIILDSRPAPCDVGLLGPNGLGLEHTRKYMAISLQVALSQAGFGLPQTDPAQLDSCKIVFAVGRQAVSSQEAERLQRYVASGGTLVFTPRFACQPEAEPKGPSLAFRAGMGKDAVPGCGLADAWDFQVTERTEIIPQYHSGEMLTFPLDGLSQSLRGVKAAGLAIFREQVRHEGWTTLAEYADHTPAIMTRTVGKGRLVYWNAVYQSHHYIQWVTPTGAERQGFYRLVEWLCEQAGAARTLRLDGPLDEVLHVAVKQFTDSTGQIRYVILRTSGEVPWVRRPPALAGTPDGGLRRAGRARLKEARLLRRSRASRPAWASQTSAIRLPSRRGPTAGIHGGTGHGGEGDARHAPTDRRPAAGSDHPDSGRNGATGGGSVPAGAECDLRKPRNLRATAVFLGPKRSARQPADGTHRP